MTNRERRSGIPIIDDDVDPYATIREFKVPITYSKGKDLSPDRFTESNKDIAAGKFLQGWGKVLTRQSLSLKEEEVIEWIEQVTHRSIPASNSTQLLEAFSDGRILCKLMNVLIPGSFKKRPSEPLERLEKFLESCEKLGVTRDEFFNPYDLVNKRSFVQVVYCLHSLAEHCHKQKRVPFFTGASRAVRNKKRLIFESDPPPGFQEPLPDSALDDSLDKEDEERLQDNRRVSRRQSPSRRKSTSRALSPPPSSQEPEFQPDDSTGAEYIYEPKDTNEESLVTRTLNRVRDSQIFFNLKHNVTSLTTRCQDTIATVEFFQLEEEWKGIFTKLVILWLICVLLWFYFFKINHTKLF